ncbi:FAS1 domain-containing protein [Acephala macrosclerotiorum]|nr:FAS1 domain-containing protein [Acephala macrosclerotiorum]
MQLSAIPSAALLTPPLLDALKTRANATKFAEFLEANPEILAIYNSSSVQASFASTNAYFTPPLRRRDTSSQQQQLQYQYTNQLTRLENLAPPALSGAVVHTELTAPKAGGTRATVSEKVAANSTTRRRKLVGATGIRMISGLGKQRFFTIPSPLPSITNSTGLSSLGSLLSSANLTGACDAADSVTVFTPSNAAFSAAANSTSNAATLPNLLYNHVNGVYFVNGARIISSNTIISNGVAHVIDKVLVPNPTPVFTGGSASLSSGNFMVVTVSAAVFAMLMM